MGVAAMKVPTIFTAVDRFSNVVDKMTRKTTMFSESASAAAMRTSTRLNSIGSKMLTSGAIIGGGLGLAVNEAIKFEKAMANVSTTIDSTPESMKKMSDEVLAMSKKIPIPLEQMTLALYDVVSAGIDAKYSMTVLKASSRLAVAGLGTAQEGVDVLTSSLNSFNIKASDSESVANMVFKAVKYGKTTVTGLAESFGNSASLIKNSNVELSEFLATTATLTTTGMSASRAQTQVASATIALIKPNKTMSRIFDKLGADDIPTYIKKSGGLVKTMRLVVDQANKMGIKLPAAFGRKEGLNAMLSLLGPLHEKFLEVNADMDKGANTLGDSFNKQMRTSAARIQILKNNMVDLAIKIGDAVLPALNSIMDTITPLIGSFTNWSEKNQWLSRTLFYVAGGLLILGVIAKVGAAIFWGYSMVLKTVTFVTTLVTTVTELYNIALLASAVSGEALVVVMGEMALASLAAAGPIIAVVAALGLLGYAIFSTNSATDTYVSKQVSGLDKTNSAWINSTKVRENELRKQSDLIDGMGKKTAPSSAILGTLSTISKRKQENWAADKQKFEETKSAFSAALIAKTPIVNGVMKLPDNTSTTEDTKNLAGANNMNIEEMYKSFQKKQTLDINLTAPDGYDATAESKDIKGIKVHTKPNQGSR